MPSNFSPPSIPQSLADAMEKDIRLGEWLNELPGNRQLAEHYHLSRNSVLKALKILETRGIVQPSEKGKRRKIALNKPNTTQKKNLKLLIVSGKYKNPASEDEHLINLIVDTWNTMKGPTVHVQVEMSRITKPENTIKRWRKDHSPDAILIYVGARKWINALVDTHLPVYCLGGEIIDSIEHISSYGYDIRKTLTNTLQKLRDNGHTRVQYPQRQGRKELNKYLLDAYQTVFGDLYSDDELKEFTPFFSENNPDQWREYWKESISRLEPTAVICERTNDLLSLYSFCNSAKIDIPKKLSVVSVSDSQHLQWLWPVPTQLIYPENKNLPHFRKWIKSDFLMRDNVKIALIWTDEGSVGSING